MAFEFCSANSVLSLWNSGPAVCAAVGPETCKPGHLVWSLDVRILILVAPFFPMHRLPNLEETLQK
jgi:hypothetical protein